MELEAGEMLVLWLMKAALDEKTEAASIEELASQENAKNMKVGDVFPFNEKVLFEYIEQKDNILALVNGMIEKGILATKEEKYCLSPLFKNIFDPEQVQDILNISRIGAFSHTKYLYILKRGYMLIEGILYDPLSWKINIVPGNIDKKNLFEMLISWEEIRMTKEFKEKIVKKMAATF